MEIQSYLSNPQGVMILRSVDLQVKIFVQEFFLEMYFETNQKTPDWWNANFRGFYFRTKFGGFNPYEPMLTW